MNKTFALALLSTSAAVGVEYSIVPDDTSSVRLEVDKTGLLRGKTHVFTFARFRGNINYVESSITSSTVNFTIEAPSIQCKDTWVSPKDLVKVQQHAERDMLAADRYKDLSFHSNSIVEQGQNALKIMGTLTIRDVTKPVEVNVRLKPAEDRSLAADGTSSIKLTDFKLEPPSAALGLIGTKDEMRLIFRLKLVQSKQ